MQRWADRRDLVMSVFAAVFLAAYAWPILQPGLGGGPRATSEVVIWVVWAAFGLDYGLQLTAAPARLRWFWRHLPELMVLVLPVLRPLRLLRVLTLLDVFNRTGSSRLRGQVGIYVGGGSALLAFMAALAVLDAERGRPGANIEGFGDALWWACTTMTTVGYGDTYPVTTTGRCVAVGLMLAGIALLGAVTASIASWLVESVSESVAEDADQSASRDRASAAQIEELRDEVRALRTEIAKATWQVPPR